MEKWTVTFYKILFFNKNNVINKENLIKKNRHTFWKDTWKQESNKSASKNIVYFVRKKWSLGP